MKIIFCAPKLTMSDTKDADIFFETCCNIWDECIVDVQKVYVTSSASIQNLRIGAADSSDIFIFFNAKDGKYGDEFIKLLKKYNEVQSRIWPIAMEKGPECRQPPPPVENMQSFDVSCWNESRNPLKNNIPAIAQVFARKIVAQTLSPLYHDEILYFISHRRCDGEKIAARLADELNLLTRRKRAYRDVVEVEVGDDAQRDIDENLTLSDAVIFLQTEEAQYSEYILKELCYALVNDIPVLWIQIDGASFSNLKIRPGERPALSYWSAEFDDPERLIEIADEIEEYCFRLIMNSSNQVCSYVEYLLELSRSNEIQLDPDKNAVLAYKIKYKTRDIYDPKIQRHYVQCFGRNPKSSDIEEFTSWITGTDLYQKSDRVFLLSSHDTQAVSERDSKVTRDNYDNYIANLENVVGARHNWHGKRIILSGAFPDCDEIYKNSLLEALSIYAKQIIRNGYTLVFGAHPTFQKIIFKIGELYSQDVRNSIEMHMDQAYANEYDLDMLRNSCELVLADGLQEMRNNMICAKKSEMLICLGGKIKRDKSQQGVDIEVNLARHVGIPVALVGTVGGRSSEYALEKVKNGEWDDLNPWGNELNENLLYNMNHRLMIKRLLNKIAGI